MALVARSDTIYCIPAECIVTPPDSTVYKPLLSPSRPLKNYMNDSLVFLYALDFYL